MLEESYVNMDGVPEEVEPPEGFRACKHCKSWFKLGEGHREQRKKYCDDACRKNHFRGEHIGRGKPKDPDHVRVAKALAKGQLDDEVRDVMRDEIRASITQVVKDRVLGAAELMAHGLPTIISQLLLDAEDENVFVRQRAQSLLLKYTMTFLDADGDNQDHGQITVIHKIPSREGVVEVEAPDSPLVQETVALMAEGLKDREEWEADYVECERCHELKHPSLIRHDMMINMDICNLCYVARRAEQGVIPGSGEDFDK